MKQENSLSKDALEAIENTLYKDALSSWPPLRVTDAQSIEHSEKPDEFTSTEGMKGASIYQSSKGDLSLEKMPPKILTPSLSCCTR